MTTPPDHEVRDGADVVRLAGGAFNAIEGQTLAAEADGGFGWVAGAAGQITWGPYIGAPAGLYRVRVEARSGEEGPPAVVEVFDPVNDCRLYAARSIDRAELELFVRVYDTPALEVRFLGERPGLQVTSVELTPLLLDRDPASPETLQDLFDHILERRGEAAAVFRVIDRLAALGDARGAQAARERFVTGRGGAAARVRAILLQLHSPGGVVREPIGASRLTEEDIQSELWRRDYDIVDAYALGHRARLNLRDHGYEPDFIEATRFHRTPDEPERAWRQKFSDDGTPLPGEPRNPLFDRAVDIDRSYQADLARGRGFPAYCPVGGGLLRSHHAFMIHFCDLPFIFYRFEGAEVFYLCVGHISAAKLFLYLPRTRTIVWIGDPWLRNYPANELTRWLEFHLIRLREGVPAYLAAPTRLAAMAGNNIIGHYFWHTLPGFEYLSKSGLLGQIEHIMSLEKTFVPAQDVFPEIDRLPASKFTWRDDSFAFNLRHNLLPAHFTDVGMNVDFVQRVRLAAARKRTPANDAPASFPHPFVWITLRAHTKVWTDQAKGYAQLVDALLQDYGQLSVYLDGMADCASIVAEFKREIDPDVVVFDGLREAAPTAERPMSLFDMLYRLRDADICVGPIGSNMVFTWQIWDKPSILHAEHGHLVQMAWLPSMGPDHRPPRVVGAHDVRNVGDGLYSDYDMDWRVLLRLVREALRESGFAATSRATSSQPGYTDPVHSGFEPG